MEPALVPKPYNSDDDDIGDDGVGGERGGWGSAVLARGWWLGKKIAFAGAAVTSAPVVIPPLLVISAVGLAFSIPFGAYLASVACTNKIMSSLLPLPPHRDLEEEEDREEDEEEEREIEPVVPSSEYSSAADEDGISDSNRVYDWEAGGEGFYSEKKIREHIAALRAIIGCSASLQLTCGEEVEGLFLFIGVDPPFSFQDADTTVVGASVRFLKCLVGVD